MEGALCCLHHLAQLIVFKQVGCGGCKLSGLHVGWLRLKLARCGKCFLVVARS